VPTVQISTRSIPQGVDTHSDAVEVASDIRNDFGEGRQNSWILAQIAVDHGVVVPVAGLIVGLKN